MTIMVLPWIMWINHYFTMDESIKNTKRKKGLNKSWVLWWAFLIEQFEFGRLKDAIQSRAVYIKNWQILEQAATLFASGTMTNEDKTIFMDEMTRLYLESKKEQKKMVEKMNRFAFLLARKEG